MSKYWLEIAQEIQSIAQAGLEYCENDYDRERYQQLRDLSVKIMHSITDIPLEKIKHLFASEKGYQTPKVDVRGVVFRHGKILMVKEKIDGKWTLPGGWADVGLSPFENVVKEVNEEAGIEVKPVKLLAVIDKQKNNYPLDAFHIYKLFILCEDSGQRTSKGMETDDVSWFSRNKIPQLSENRISKEQIAQMFEFYDNPTKEIICD
ncbi:MAG: NUDIX hydrolase [Bacteroidales bacterium]|nr:NUDIX hydrolase [Bacteroidales bacterium]